jgi:hypothetical protein
METENVTSFLSSLHNEADTWFRCIDGSRIKDFKGKLTQEMFADLRRHNEQGYNIYFVPNTGGFKDEQIIKFNSTFIDLDCGKDDLGNYFSLEAVSEYKQTKLDEIPKE